VIVKVQISVAGNTEEPWLLIYDESRDVMVHQPAPINILSLMGDRPKAFFHASVRDNEVSLFREAPWQEW
jgi:hypothetical protein